MYSFHFGFTIKLYVFSSLSRHIFGLRQQVRGHTERAHLIKAFVRPHGLFKSMSR